MKLDVVKDEITPDLVARIRKLENKRPLLRAAAGAAREAMREHYEGLPPNERGFPSSGFWRKEGTRRVAIASVGDEYAEVVVDSVAMGHRFFGGVVTPKRGRALSIPLSLEAYATGSASLWTGPKLTLIERRGKSPLLVDASREDAWDIHYVLVPRVEHDPDPRAFPRRGPVDAAVGRMLREKLDVILRVS